MTVLSSEMYLSRAKDIAARTLGDDTVIMSTVDSTIFMLNGTGTFIWKAADGKTPFSTLLADIAREFDVTDDLARADAEKFVAELVEHRILSISDVPAEAP